MIFIIYLIGVTNGISKSKHSASNHILDCCNNKNTTFGKYIWKLGIIE